MLTSDNEKTAKLVSEELGSTGILQKYYLVLE